MIRAILNLNQLFNDLMDACINSPVFARVLDPIMEMEREDFNDVMRGYALYKAKVAKIMGEASKYVITGSEAYYKNKHGETTAITRAEMLIDGNIEVTLYINSKKFESGIESRARKLFMESIRKPSTVTEFIDYLRYVGLSKFGGKTYTNMDYVLPRVSATFPDFNKELYVQERIDLLESAAEKCIGDDNVLVLGTMIIYQLIERGLVSEYRRKNDGRQYVTYHFIKKYMDGDKLKFITYYYKPSNYNEYVAESMSPMNLRDLIVEE